MATKFGWKSCLIILGFLLHSREGRFVWNFHGVCYHGWKIWQTFPYLVVKAFSNIKEWRITLVVLHGRVIMDGRYVKLFAGHSHNIKKRRVRCEKIRVEVCGLKGFGCHGGRQELSRYHTRGESGEAIVCSWRNLQVRDPLWLWNPCQT